VLFHPEIHIHTGNEIDEQLIATFSKTAFLSCGYVA
jgi:hypothetical protein